MVNVRCGAIQFSQVQAVIFDKDGTLADSKQYLRQLGYQRAHYLTLAIGSRATKDFKQSLLRSWGVTENCVDPTGQIAVASQAEEEIATAGQLTALGYGWIDALEIVRRSFGAVELTEASLTPAFAGVGDCLRGLHSAGLKVGILSSDSTDSVKAFVNHCDLTPILELCWGAQSADFRKPDPRLFHRACAALGVEASRTLMVGDSRADIDMAKRAEAQGAIGAAWGWPPFDLPGVDVMLDKIGDIAASVY
ncbi:MAG: HAD family hydrolase [Alkalinema sp. CAN_BIN05]|nr:HAD family hydrolase [Alkalinema sp. CAN_BIN05]